jgi:pimeloyl-ACP methyl ester carboxylesterase
MKKRPLKTIVFITGAFVSNSCWDEWRIYFENNGYYTHIPAWPHKDAPADELRQRHPDTEVASTRLTDLVEFYTGIIKQLPDKPILIGHSMGGLITQLLLQHDLALAGIAIHSLQPQRVRTFKYSSYKAGWGALGYFTSTKETYLMSFREWQYAFTNDMPFEEQKEAYYKLLVPESKLVIRDTLTKAARVDFSKPHAPLLFVSGSMDHFIPASLNYSNYKKYTDSNSITDYIEFTGRNHFVLGQSTWKENADYIIDWLEKQSI